MPSSTPSQAVRINKYIAQCGVASRRQADELILAGKVIINGEKIRELGIRVIPGKDKVKVKGKFISAESKKLYFMLNKPSRVMSTRKDPEGRPTVMDYFKKVRERIFPVGRLDWDSEGLILLTNDGEFSQSILHPSKEIAKTYEVKINGKISPRQIETLKRGVTIPGGKVSAKEVRRKAAPKGKDVKTSKKYEWVVITITEGKNRQIRKMFEKVRLDVIKLRRVSIGKLRLGSLKPGKTKQLTSKDVEKIFFVEPRKAK